VQSRSFLSLFLPLRSTARELPRLSAAVIIQEYNNTTCSISKLGIRAGRLASTSIPCSFIF
jgi:hypothetical protein